jgi:hypothetical protein
MHQDSKKCVKKSDEQVAAQKRRLPRQQSSLLLFILLLGNDDLKMRYDYTKDLLRVISYTLLLFMISGKFESYHGRKA